MCLPPHVLFDCASLNSVVRVLGGPGFETVVKPAVMVFAFEACASIVYPKKQEML